MAATAISPALPAIEATFAATESAALLTRLLVTMPALVIAIVAPVAGSLTDRFGRRRVLVSSILLYGFAGLSGLVLDSLHGLLVGRALLGAAVAGIMTASTALVGDLFSRAERDRFMGWQAAFTGIGGLLFMTVGGLLAEASWRMPFAIYGFAFLVLPAVLVHLAEPKRGERLSGSEGLSRIPLMAVTALYLAGAFNSVIFYLIPTQLPFYLHSLGVNAPSLIGVTIGVFTLSSAITSLVYGKVRQHVPLLGMFVLGFSLMAAGYYVMASAASHSLVLAGLVITGVGMSGIMPSLMAGAMLIAPPSSRGRIAGGLTASIFLGQFLSPLVSQSWIEWFGYQATFRDMGTALIAAASIAIVGVILSKREPAKLDLDRITLKKTPWRRCCLKTSTKAFVVQWNETTTGQIGCGGERVNAPLTKTP
jgi:MFS family permease